MPVLILGVGAGGYTISVRRFREIFLQPQTSAGIGRRSRVTAGWRVAATVFSTLALTISMLGGASVASALQSPAAAATTSVKGYTPLVPVRICDTRAVAAGFVAANQCNNSGASAGTLGPAASLNVSVADFGVPATATAVVLNVTATDTTATSYLTVWPATTARPTASNLNWDAGQTIPNLVEVAVVNSQANAYNNQGSADVVIDLEGYVDSASSNLYTPVTPERICDTRAAGLGVASNQCEASNGAAGSMSSGRQHLQRSRQRRTRAAATGR